MVQTQVELREEQLEALRTSAAALGVSVSELVRRAVDALRLAGPRTSTDEGTRRTLETDDDPADLRSREDAWRRAHRDLLQRQFAGQWVVLEGEEIMAHDKNAAQAVTQARAKGVAIPYVFYVEPPAPPGVVRIGL